VDPVIQQSWDDWRECEECKRRIREALAKKRAENAANGTSFIQQYREAHGSK
jgi:hypothetical protein